MKCEIIGGGGGWIGAREGDGGWASDDLSAGVEGGLNDCSGSGLEVTSKCNCLPDCDCKFCDCGNANPGR